MGGLFSRFIGRLTAAVKDSPGEVSSAEWRSRGNAALSEGNLAAAADFYRRAVDTDPRDALARLNLGFALFEQSDAAAAQEQLTQALVLRQTDQDILHDVHYLLGRAYRAQGKDVLAIQSFEAALKLLPCFAEAMEELAQMLYAAGRYAESLDWSERLQRLRPSLAAEILLAQSLEGLGRAAESLAVLDGVVTKEHAPDAFGLDALAQHLRGNVLFAMGRHAEAAAAYDAAFEGKPDFAEAAASAAAAWYRVHRPDMALLRAEQALELRPGHVRSLCNRVIALQSLGRHDDAIAAAHALHRQWPHDTELQWTYGATMLLNGDFERGLPALEARWSLPGAGKRPDPRELGCPVWTGAEPVERRTLLLVAEQGFGDTLQFVRYAPELARLGAKVVLAVPEALEALLRVSMPECSVVTRLDETSGPAFHIPMMSLPLAMRSRLESIPSSVPYLQADPERVEHWRACLPSAPLRVGLVLSGNAAHANDRNRSIPLQHVMQIAVPGVLFVSLQREVRASDQAALTLSGFVDVADEIRSFADTAALVQALDLVISVDTSVAHLAGALARPLWLLLPHRPDWRWLLERDDSPWYPSARLFRQPAPGLWDPVLAEVRGALAELLSAKSPASA